MQVDASQIRWGELRSETIWLLPGFVVQLSMLESCRLRINGINMQTFHRAAESPGWKWAGLFTFWHVRLPLDPYYIDYKDVHEYLNRIVQFNISVRAASWCAWIDNDGYNFPTVRLSQWETIVVISVLSFFFFLSFFLSWKRALFICRNFARLSDQRTETFREIILSVFRTPSRVSQFRPSCNVPLFGGNGARYLKTMAKLWKFAWSLRELSAVCVTRYIFCIFCAFRVFHVSRICFKKYTKGYTADFAYFFFFFFFYIYLF